MTVWPGESVSVVLLNWLDMLQNTYMFGEHIAGITSKNTEEIN